MTKNYIDIEVTMTQRHYFKGKTDMKAIAEIVRNSCNLDDVLDKERGFLKTVHSPDDEAFEDNSTIRIFQNGERINVF